MDEDREVAFSEIRYAERLCLRTARLYRRLQAIGTFLTVVSGSAVLTAFAQGVPMFVRVAGAVGFAVFGAALIAVRPADKAASNEADAKRYAQLRTAADGLESAAAVRAALDKARESDAAEVEGLRDVALNDVLQEIGRPDEVKSLSPKQRLLAALA